MDSWLVVSRADGSTVRHAIEGEQATVGKSPTAGIPLVNCEELMDEHMLVAPRPDGCWVSVRHGAFPAVTLKGRTIEGEIVPWGSELMVGQVSILVTDKLSADIKKGKGDKQVSSPVMVLMFVLIPLVGWLLLSDPQASLPTGPEGAPPELFDEVTECPDSGSQAHHRAKEAAEAASHRAERYPFEAQDGVRAVQLYATAELCYTAAGESGDAARIRREKEALSQRLEEDYRTHRLRLERGLELERWDEALIEAKNLNDLLAHRRDSEYGQWMELLERRLQLMVDQALARRDEDE
jgi:hypothetical protein